MVTNDNSPKSGNLPITLATWIYLLYDSGRLPEDAELRAACEALRAAGVEITDEPADFNELGQALTALVDLRIAGVEGFDGVLTWLRALFGNHLTTEMGGDRDSRLHRARTYQFQTNLPWLARVIDRFPNGHVGAHWVMVESVTDGVRCMDPYPWDELDEEYTQPIVDFMVKWELAGGQGIRYGQP
jgi:hypothetical protein